jgi:hypothetical protein
MSDEKVESSSLAWYGVVWEFGVMVFFTFLFFTHSKTLRRAW